MLKSFVNQIKKSLFEIYPLAVLSTLAFGCNGQNLAALGSSACVISPQLSQVTLSNSQVVSGGQVKLQLLTSDLGGHVCHQSGLNVAFTTAGGTSTGIVGPITDNTDGTYVAAFTSQNSGTAIAIGATINGNAISSLPPMLTVMSGAASVLVLSAGNNQSTTAGMSLPSPLKVLLQDSTGNPVAGVSVTWAATSGQGSTATCAGSVTNSSGIATCSPTVGLVAGPNSFSASASGANLPATFSAHGSGFSTMRGLVGNSPNGYYPLSSLIQIGAKFYGTSMYGGTTSYGTIFSVNPDGTQLTVVYNFTNGSDGATPRGNLLSVGQTLYGTTSAGGVSSSGTIFSVNADGTNFLVLHTFTGGGDGATLNGSLIISGNTLYGMSSTGGSSAKGTIFSVGIDGSNFTVLHTFTGSGTDGASPVASLVLSSGSLYGLTSVGGSSNLGTLFSIAVDGSAFTTLHSFTSAVTDGSTPRGSLIISGTTLFGTTTLGGAHSRGTIFSYTIGGSFSLLYSFNGGATDGSGPRGDLLLSGGILYGLAPSSGASSMGVIFTFNIGTSTESILYSFLGGSDGAAPQDGLLLTNGVLYGVTKTGGPGNYGTVFSISPNGSNYVSLTSFAGPDGAYPNGDVLLLGTTLYGMSYYGGIYNNGNIFSMNVDGTNYTLLHEFVGGTTDGAYPYGNLVAIGNVLYGMTSYGAAHYDGNIFSINTDGTNYSVLHTFSGSSTDGGAPYGSLVAANGILYGMTADGGAAGVGAIFSIAPSGANFTILYSFSGAGGSYPSGNLIVSGNTLFGMASSGGSANVGTIFSVGITGANFTVLHTFLGGTSDGSSPSGSLILTNNTLYGLTANGGTAGDGIIFSISTTGLNYTNLHSFAGGSSDGANPYGTLLLNGNTLYGMTSAGASASQGNIFSIGLDGTNYSSLYTFTGAADGGDPEGSLIFSAGTLYGTTSGYGAFGNGTIFSLGL